MHLIKDDLSIVADPDSPPEEYRPAMRRLSWRLGKRVCSKLSNGGHIHAVGAAADFELALMPAVAVLRRNDFKVRLTCVWPEYAVIGNGVDTAPITMAISQKAPSEKEHLLLASQVIGTITEMESIVAHVLKNIRAREYESLTVTTAISHVEAKRTFIDALPPQYAEAINWFDHRNDLELTNEGILFPGIGGTNYERSGFERPRQVRTYVPSEFRQHYDYERIAKPQTGPTI